MNLFMLSTNINKISAFVIFASISVLFLIACDRPPMKSGRPPVFEREASAYNPPAVVGKIESREITESSGLAVSKCQENVIWTHNDSGDGPFIFALDQNGRHLGTWKVENAKNVDWEDIALLRDSSGTCFLYIAEIGNSKDGARIEHSIYKVAEPQITEVSPRTGRKNAGRTDPAEALPFSYPGRKHNAETILIDPGSGAIYVITKERAGPAVVYKLDPVFGEQTRQIAARVAEISVPALPIGMLTGGDVSSDGKRVIICDYFAAYEFVLPEGAASFDAIWAQKPSVIDLGPRKQGEAIAYSANGLSIFATSEGRNPPIIEVKRRE